MHLCCFRAFSRQYTGRLTSYEELLNFSMLDHGGRISKSDTPKSSNDSSKKISRSKLVTSAYQKLLHNRLGTIFTDILFENNLSSQQHFMDMESISSLQATSLQCRIKKVVYIIQARLSFILLFNYTYQRKFYFIGGELINDVSPA